MWTVLFFFNVFVLVGLDLRITVDLCAAITSSLYVIYCTFWPLVCLWWSKQALSDFTIQGLSQDLVFPYRPAIEENCWLTNKKSTKSVNIVPFYIVITFVTLYFGCKQWLYRFFVYLNIIICWMSNIFHAWEPVIKHHSVQFVFNDGI